MSNSISRSAVGKSLPSRIVFSIQIFAAVSVMLLASCKDQSTSPPEQSATGADANGGSWRTLVIASGSVVTAAAPVAAGSPAALAELAQVRAARAALSSTAMEDVRRWDSNAVVRWNEAARSLVIKYSTNPPLASRVYAMLTAAQYDAAVTTWSLKYRYDRSAPYKADNTIVPVTTPLDVPSYPSDHAAIAGASVAILSALYPKEITYLDSLASAHETSRIAGGYNYPSDVTVGDSIGRVIGAAGIAHGTSDGSNAVWHDTIPLGPQYWYSAQRPPVAPLLPLWGAVTPWLITNMQAVEPSAPPAFLSASFDSSLAEVRHISDARTAEQTAIAIKWADGAGTFTPPGHWNAIACNALLLRGWNTLRSARALALMNLAMMDAGICCWKTKYEYWLIRPSEVDTNITLAVPLPNFPSYCSGHSSFSSAAAEVLGYLMPDKASDFQSMASEAAISRVYGGIHYRFDSDAGLTMGKKVGDLAIARGRVDGSN